MNQNFSADQLLKLCKASEIYEYNTSKAAIIIKANEAFEKILNGTFEFNIRESGDVYLTEELVDKLIIRKLNDNLKRLYKEEQSNRRIIIDQVAVLLEDTCPFYILKTDISKFYDSIDKLKLLDKLESDSMLSYFSVFILKRILFHPLLKEKKGLPKGISISSTLSEIYMRKFDRWVKSYTGVYYYARFVDDIVIFFHNEKCLHSLNDSIDLNLETGLVKNSKKTFFFDGDCIDIKKPLEYLGYSFSIEKVKEKNKTKKNVKISIASKKVKKIKSRVVYSFLDFIKKKDFALLEKRIKFLTGNYSIRGMEEGHDLRAGIYYNYNSIQANNLSVFYDLNLFYYKTLNSKRFSFGIKLNQALTPQQKSRLFKYSFKHGFKSKIYHSFSYSDLKKISSCWK